jgi:NTP pyrophosphatase (non-canonical NTP hydrolase)
MNTMQPYRQLDELQEKQWQWVEQQDWHNKTRLEYLALITSEVGEAVNEARGEDVDEKYYFELADIGLRLLDLAEVEGISLQEYMEKKMEINLQRIFGKDKEK